MSVPARNAGTLFAMWVLMALYAAARVMQVFPGRVPMVVVVVLHVFPPLVFAMIHGAMIYRWRGMVVFFGVFLVVGNTVENLGVRTGIPFGHYYFTGLMGPKIFYVPVMLGLAYLGMGYISWTLGRVILGGMRRPLSGGQVVFVPLVASFIMVAWDLAMDPVWGTVLHAWIWVDGGAYFGVPVTNFIGWYLSVYVMYQLFAIYLRGRPGVPAPLPRGYWHMAVWFYGTCAAGNVLLAIPQSGLSVVADPGGRQWQVSSILAACVLVSVFVMGAFTVMAWARIWDENCETVAVDK